MYEIHGWFGIAETPEESDGGNLLQKVNELKTLVSQFNFHPALVDIRACNGEFFLHLGGQFKRNRQYNEDIDKILTFLAEKLPGSYGLLYWRDNEDSSPPGLGEFHVKVLARGMLTDRFDPFLSPVVPTIEN
jgi:Immunity protein 7